MSPWKETMPHSQNSKIPKNLQPKQKEYPIDTATQATHEVKRQMGQPTKDKRK